MQIPLFQMCLLVCIEMLLLDIMWEPTLCMHALSYMADVQDVVSKASYINWKQATLQYKRCHARIFMMSMQMGNTKW